MENNSVYYIYASKRLSAMNLQQQENKLDIDIGWCRYIEDDVVFNPISVDKHKHTYYEMLFMLNGWNKYAIEDESDVITSSGEFLLISKGVRHAEIERENKFNCQRFAVLFDLSELTGEAVVISKALSQSSYIIGRISKYMMDTIERILREAHDPTMMSKQIIKSSIITLIGDAIRQINCIEIYNSNYNINQKLNDTDTRLEAMQKYIRDNISRNITIEDLVSYMYMSPRQLNYLVKKEKGMSIRQYIDYIRCAKARELLLNTDMYISDISFALGFLNVNSFNRFFKRIEGMAPGKYRSSKGK